MGARFLIMQRCKLAFDLSGTDDAQPNNKLEAHLLRKASELSQAGVRPIFKAHVVCRLHQQQLGEGLLLAVAGTWILGKLFSFTVFVTTGGVMARIIRESRAVTRGVIVNRRSQPPFVASILREVRDHIRANLPRLWKLQRASVERGHHWVHIVSLEPSSNAEHRGPATGIRHEMPQKVDSCF